MCSSRRGRSRRTGAAEELTEVDVRERWADISLYTASADAAAALGSRRSSTSFCRSTAATRGQRSALLAFNVGQGTQDIGFRSDIDILFTALPAHPVRLRVVDEHGEPTTAAFLVKDDAETDLSDGVEAPRA